MRAIGVPTSSRTTLVQPSNTPKYAPKAREATQHSTHKSAHGVLDNALLAKHTHRKEVQGTATPVSAGPSDRTTQLVLPPPGAVHPSQTKVASCTDDTAQQARSRATLSSAAQLYPSAQGHQVHFQEENSAWRAQVTNVWGCTQKLPVVCAPGQAPDQAIQQLASKAPGQHKYRIHILETDQPPWAPRVVYVGALGLRGGGNSSSSDKSGGGSSRSDGVSSGPMEEMRKTQQRFAAESRSRMRDVDFMMATSYPDPVERMGASTRLVAGHRAEINRTISSARDNFDRSIGRQNDSYEAPRREEERRRREANREVEERRARLDEAHRREEEERRKAEEQQAQVPTAHESSASVQEDEDDHVEEVYTEYSSMPFNPSTRASASSSAARVQEEQEAEESLPTPWQGVPFARPEAPDLAAMLQRNLQLHEPATGDQVEEDRKMPAKLSASAQPEKQAGGAVVSSGFVLGSDGKLQPQSFRIPFAAPAGYQEAHEAGVSLATQDAYSVATPKKGAMLRQSVETYQQSCAADIGFQQQRGTLSELGERLKKETSNEDLERQYQEQEVVFQQHPLYQQGCALAKEAQKLRDIERSKADHIIISKAEMQMGMGSGKRKQREQHRQAASAIRDELVQPVREILERPSTPPKTRLTTAFAKGVGENVVDTAKLVVDVSVVAAKVLGKGIYSLATWEDQLGIGEKVTEASEVVKAFCEDRKYEWENPAEYRKRVQKAQAIRKELDIAEQALNADAYHQQDMHNLGYWSGEALQAVFGAEVVKGGVKLAKSGAQAAGVAQKAAKVAKATKVAKALPAAATATKTTQKVVRGAEAAEGVGKAVKRAANQEIKIASEGIQNIERHLATMDFDQANQVMIKRLKDIASGTLKPTNVDLNFYAHELREMELMKQGMGYTEAHAKALKEYGIAHKKGYKAQLYTKKALREGDKGMLQEAK